MSVGGNRRPFPLRALVLAFTLIYMAPAQLGEVKRVTVRVLESYARARLSFVYDSLEFHALGFQRAHGIVDGAAQLEADRHGPFAAGSRVFRSRMQADGQPFAGLHRSPVVAKAILQLQSEHLGIEADRGVHIRN